MLNRLLKYTFVGVGAVLLLYALHALSPRFCRWDNDLFGCSDVSYDRSSGGIDWDGQ